MDQVTCNEFKLKYDGNGSFFTHLHNCASLEILAYEGINNLTAMTFYVLLKQAFNTVTFEFAIFFPTKCLQGMDDLFPFYNHHFGIILPLFSYHHDPFTFPCVSFLHLNDI